MQVTVDDLSVSLLHHSSISTTIIKEEKRRRERGEVERGDEKE